LSGKPIDEKMRPKLEEHMRLMDVKCGDPENTAMGNEMYKWMNETMIRWD